MSPSKRDRENARRRHERHQQQLAARRAAGTRRRQLAVAVLAVLVALVLVVVAVLVLGDDDGDDVGDATTSAPDPSVAQDRTWTGTITTDVGEIGIELDGAAAPQAVASFVTLAQDGYFDDTPCHRLVTGGIKVLQCGDPTGTGTGDPGYAFGPIENAPEDEVYPTGAIAMARLGNDADSMGSQFFLVYEDSVIPADQAGGYTVFGRVTSGLDVVQAVADAGVEGGGSDGPPATGVTIQGVETQ